MKTSGKSMVADQQFKHEQNTAHKKSPTGHTDPVAVGGMLRLCISSVCFQHYPLWGQEQC